METIHEPGGPHDSLEKNLFEGEGTGQETDSDRSSHDGRSQAGATPPTTPPKSPQQRLDFAPGLSGVKVRTRLQGKMPSPLNLHAMSKLAKNLPLEDIHDAYSTVVDSVAHANQARSFIEELKFLVISSQLCDDQPSFGSLSMAPLPTNAPPPEVIKEIYIHPWTTNGAVATGALSFTIACLVRWFYIGGTLIVSLRRIVIAAVALTGVAWVLRIYMRRQWSKYIHEQALNEMRRFVRTSSDFDSLASSALSFVLEVELVSRGFRVSLPLPPLSRMESNGQELRSLNIRKELHQKLKDVIDVYYSTAVAIREFADQAELKLNDTGLKCDPLKIKAYYGGSSSLSPEETEAVAARLDKDSSIKEYVDIQGFTKLSEKEAHMTAQLRETLRFARDTRRMFLVGLVSLETTGSKAELLHYTAALEGIRKCNMETQKAALALQRVLLPPRDKGEEQTPLSPRHAKWKHQIMKVGDMNMSIRNIQAKMALLLDESRNTLDKGTANDVTELGPMFMGRYEAIGNEIKDLMDAWEAGKASLASTIDKNERRVSSMSSALSPSGIASRLPSLVDQGGEDGGVAEAWDRLTSGEAPPMTDSSTSPVSPATYQPHVMETFEAIATPRPRSMLTRQERIQRVNEERAMKLAARERALQQGWIMGELKDVLKSRGLHGVVDTNGERTVSPRTSLAPSFRPGSRVTSMPL
ncbi:hypothetical protein JX266_005204 [Neoarthrinium moseri]|nr:hypothetical protein JX266_005204 [Neoarthrinium moseri]